MKVLHRDLAAAQNLAAGLFLSLVQKRKTLLSALWRQAVAYGSDYLVTQVFESREQLKEFQQLFSQPLEDLGPHSFFQSRQELLETLDSYADRFVNARAAALADVPLKPDLPGSPGPSETGAE